MKIIFKYISKKGVAGLREELMRAHLIIAILSLISIVLLVLGVNLSVGFDYQLSMIAGILLATLCIISVGIISYLRKNKR